MKTRRRHDLKSNKLADSLTEFVDFLRDHGTKLLAGTLVALLVVVGLVVVYNNSRQARYRSWQQLFNAVMGMPGSKVDDLRTLAEQSGDEKVAALAWKHYGDQQLIRYAAAYSGDRAKILGQAQEAYKAILDRYSENISAAAGARMGLAVVYENLGRWDDAAATYDELAKDRSLAGLGISALASARMARLDQRQALSTHIQAEPAATTRPAMMMPAMPAEKLGK